MTASKLRRERLLNFVQRVEKGTISWDNNFFVSSVKESENEPCKTCFCVAGDAVLNMGRDILDVDAIAINSKNDVYFNPDYVKQLVKSNNLGYEDYYGDYLWKLGMIYYELNALEANLLFNEDNKWIWVKAIAEYLSENLLNNYWEISVVLKRSALISKNPTENFLLHTVHRMHSIHDEKNLNKLIGYLNSKGIKTCVDRV